MANPAITCVNLTFSWPDDTPVFRDLSFTVPDGRTGLVAPNGAGKSTLLRLIAGELLPGSGAVTTTGPIGYLPQTLPLSGDLTVAGVLDVATVLRALAAIESGDAAEEHFTVVGNDWDIQERAEAELSRLGLGDVALHRPLDSLSGGQVVSLGLAAQLLKQPDILLLDEPTNNLDLDARRKLMGVVDDWRGCLLLVSHDRALLDRMDRIAELHEGEIAFYGGNFAAYEEALRQARENAEKNIRSAEQDVKREKHQQQQARERAARRAGNASRGVKDAGLPKIFAGTMKRNAQESAARSDQTHAARIGLARARLDEAGRTLRADPVLALDLPGTTVPAGRTLFAGRGLQVAFDGRPVFAGAGIDLDIRGPERIALTGPNGAGKSTLLRVLRGDNACLEGDVRRSDGRIAFLSQRLDLLDPDLTVAENLAAFAPGLGPAEDMNLLARFLFRGDRVRLPVHVLSGGELLRATLACVLYAEPAPTLLLLDEPTNNLDLASVGQLQNALTAFRGAFVVVSHDQRFLAEIGIDRWLRLADGRLTTVTDPDQGLQP